MGLNGARIGGQDDLEEGHGKRCLSEMTQAITTLVLMTRLGYAYLAYSRNEEPCNYMVFKVNRGSSLSSAALSTRTCDIGIQRSDPAEPGVIWQLNSKFHFLRSFSRSQLPIC